MKKRITALVLILIMMISSIGVLARETDFFDESFTPVPKEEQKWGTAHRDEFDAVYNELDEAYQAGDEPEAVIALCEKLEVCFEKLQTEAVFCELDYYRNPQEYSESYTAWSNLMTNMSNDAIKLYQQLIANGYEEEFRRVLGDEYCDMIIDTHINDEYELKLLEKETELVNKYNLVISEVYDSKSRNRKAAPIMAELVKIRNEYARRFGYENYAYYAYDVIYCRDYTPDDMEAFYKAVKEYFVPIDEKMITMTEYNSDLSAENIENIWGLSEEEIVAAAEEWIDDISDEYKAALDYMKEYDLCDFEPSRTKLQLAFTTFLYRYDSACIFAAPTYSYDDVMTFVHEFGHFANIVLTRDGASACYDISEIHSQGLEMLYMEYADTLAGENGGDAYRAAGLSNMVYSVVEGALHDEFQQALYTNENMSVEEMNETFKRISQEYGYEYGENEDAYWWVDINHTFDSPFYYISYSVSALGAMEILCISVEDFEKAADVYLALASQMYVYGYSDAVEQAGLSNVFEDGSVEKIAEGIMDYTIDEICDIKYIKEIENHWAKDYLTEGGIYGLFKGDEGGRVHPDREMTVAEAITVLWRLNGCRIIHTEMEFVDVNHDDWYYDAVAWFVGRMKQNDELKNMVYKGRFGAEEKVSRMMFVWMYHLLNGQIECETDYLDEFTDGDKVPENMRDAMNWAIEAGLIEGYDTGELDPEGYLTRAEIAKIILK
ncbi:MAG: S-layer homology domain-containing protein [Clostridia bacterium]|nr:S-layer homology domain-containing protein [Clostridia bacterium]